MRPAQVPGSPRATAMCRNSISAVSLSEISSVRDTASATEWPGMLARVAASGAAVDSPA